MDCKNNQFSTNINQFNPLMLSMKNLQQWLTQ